MKLLSIILPTYNRLQYLKVTLPIIKNQIQRNSEDVELVICNNASTDGTVEYLNSLPESERFFRLVDYSEYVPVSESICRSASNSRSKYLLLWGDDDIPSPMMIDTILLYLREYPDTSCLVFNRIQGNMATECYMNNMKVYDKKYREQIKFYTSSNDFIKDHYQDMGFLSVDVISTECWKEGVKHLNEKYIGYEFLAVLLYGIIGKSCLYLNFPICIQRLVRRPEYYNEWPIYGFVGMPSLLKDLGEKGILSNWKDVWKNYQSNGTSLKTFLPVALTCSTDKKKFKPYYSKICEFQDSKLRKSVLWFCIYVLPKWFYPLLQTIFIGKNYKHLR